MTRSRLSVTPALEQMRILYLTNGFPYPLTSGYLRHYFLIRGLSERHTVCLFSLVGRDFRIEHRDALAPFTSRIRTFGTPGRRRSNARKIGEALRHLVPGAGDGRAIEEMRSTLRRSLREERFDLVLFSGKATYPVIRGLEEVPIVADVCDATSMRIRGRMRHCGLARLPALYAEYLQMRAVERRLVRHASHLVFASRRDREAVLGVNGTRASVIPNGVNLDYWTRRSEKRGTDVIVMTGAMDYAPNYDAAMYLIQEILPRVRRSVPDVRLFVVGRDAPAKLREAGRRHGATVTGFVEDVRPYMEQASVFAAPLRFGAGIQNKLLEAMAMGVPVVTSPLAADGLRGEDGGAPPVAVAASADDFAERILQRLAATREDAAPDVEARRFVEQHFVWSTSAAKLEQVMTSLVARGVR